MSTPYTLGSIDTLLTFKYCGVSNTIAERGRRCVEL